MRYSKHSSRNVTIEYLRFVFAGIVVLHHSRYILGDEDCWFLGGSLAVEFFLFVSGYLLQVSAEKKEGRAHLWDRRRCTLFCTSCRAFIRNL